MEDSLPVVEPPGLRGAGELPGGLRGPVLPQIDPSPVGYKHVGAGHVQEQGLYVHVVGVHGRADRVADNRDVLLLVLLLGFGHQQAELPTAPQRQ